MPTPTANNPMGREDGPAFQLWGQGANGEGSKKSAPAGPDFTAAAQQQAQLGTQATNAQTQANRPNQSNAFGAGVQWTQNPDGSWTQAQSFGGPLGGASSALQGQAAQSLATPFDFSSLGALGTGDEARQQAIDSAFGQAKSRLDPRFQQEEEALRTRLLNQGLDPNSEAARNAMQQFGQQKNDAYSSALASAITQGTAAGNSVFQNNLAQRGQMLSEGLLGRSLPLQSLLQMRGLLDQPGFMGAGRAETPNLLGAASLQDASNFRNWEAEGQRNADLAGGVMDLAGSFVPFLF